MDTFDAESTATHAVQQARLLVHRAELAASVATHQAVALLHDQGMSHRQIARLTGLSKSDVARKAANRPPIGVAQREGGDSRVNDFALDWIWGDRETERRVVSLLLGEDETSTPTRGLATHDGYAGPTPTNFGGTNGPQRTGSEDDD
jgi:hypothetical protein